MDTIEKPTGVVDYRKRVSMPIRDTHRDGCVMFWVDVYGVEPLDLCTVPGGGEPMRKAVERLGLDTDRYQAWILDVPIKWRRSVT